MSADIIANFHLLRPYWLLALLPILLFIVWQYRRSGQDNPWQQVIEPHLLSHMLIPQSSLKTSTKWYRRAIVTAATLSVLALSGPTFEKRPLPVFETELSKIVLLDLSMSMLSEDVEPSRLERAKFKINDLLQQTNEGSIALIVYAGDAFVISPLTTDARTIATLIPPLSPTLMPVFGSQPVSAFKLAEELFANSGVFSGQIIWITDGIDDNDFLTLAQTVSDIPHQVSILAVGTVDGAPIPMPDGQGFLKDGAGQIVIPRLNFASLEEIAKAAKGNISPLTPGDEDITFLMSQLKQPQEFIASEDDLELDTWIEFGPWLLLPVVLLLSLSFRRGFIFSLLVVGFFVQPSTPLSAAENVSEQQPPRAQTFWESLWLTPDQQAQRAFKSEQHQNAADLFNNPAWKSASLYRSGEYEASIFANQEGVTATDWYNRGNALAFAGDLETAIKAYEEALKQFPDMPDAVHNKKIVEDLLKQQQEQEQQNQDQDQQDESQEDQDQQEQEQNQENDQEQQDQQQQQQQQKQQQEQEMKELEEMSEEEKQQVLEQWLRQIKDDPGGLLRRKMYMEYQKRQQQNKKLQRQGEKVW